MYDVLICSPKTHNYNELSLSDYYLLIHDRAALSFTVPGEMLCDNYSLNDVIIFFGTEVIRSILKISDKVAEWLRRWTANPFPSGSVGSNPILVEYFYALNAPIHLCIQRQKS